MLGIGLWIATGLLVVATAIPILRAEGWWVRSFDFPRLQFVFAALILLAAQLTWLDFSRADPWVAMALTVSCVAYQAWWILPFSPLHQCEVKDAGGPDRDNSISIFTANVLGSNRKADQLLALVRTHRPDVLVTLESDSWWQGQLDQLEPDYPYALKCPLDNLYGMHVYSRYPLENGKIQYLVEDDVPSMHVQAKLPSGQQVAMHFLHPAPPSPTENATSSERDAELIIVARSLADAEVPVIVAGDLNDVAWSATTRLFRKISGLLDPRIGRGMFNSYHARIPMVRWPLDHLFHSAHFALDSMRCLPAFGSDHFPVLVRLVCQSEKAEQEGLSADEDDQNRADEKLADESVSPSAVHRPEAP